MSEGRIAEDFGIDLNDFALDRREHLEAMAATADRPAALTLPQPTASRRQIDLIDLAHHPRGEIIQADAHQLARFFHRPGVPRVVSKVGGRLEPSHDVHRKGRRFFPRFRRRALHFHAARLPPLQVIVVRNQKNECCQNQCGNHLPLRGAQPPCCEAKHSKLTFA